MKMSQKKNNLRFTEDWKNLIAPVNPDKFYFLNQNSASPLSLKNAIAKIYFQM